MIMKSQGWCCEKCGGLIKGNCWNVEGFVTHTGSCIDEDEAEEIGLKFVGERE